MGAVMTIINSNTRLTQLPAGARPAAMAGYFYPDDPAALRRMITELLGPPDAKYPAPKALIVPHAGYIYSGPVAATAYATLAAARDSLRRVVLLGPAHRVYVRGLALTSADRFETPLGPIEIDQESRRALRGLPQVRIMDEAHAEEHSLEVQLPFLQIALNRFSLVPVVVGEAAPEEVATVLRILWGGDETLIVVSSDLSHYLDYETARRVDAETSAAIVDLRLEAIGPHDACGCAPLRGLLLLGRERDLDVQMLDLRNSGDTAGSRERVVGYGSFAVRAKPRPLKAHADDLLGLARASIQSGFESGRPLRPDAGRFPASLQERRAVFVTLTQSGQLRGCIGNTEASEPLACGVARYAFNAAFRDPRFPPLTAGEYGSTQVCISILSHCESVDFTSETHLVQLLRPGVDGLIIEAGAGRATFLPAVWEQIRDPREFLAQLKQKAGLTPSTVPQRAWRYTTESISDPPESVSGLSTGAFKRRAEWIAGR